MSKKDKELQDSIDELISLSIAKINSNENHADRAITIQHKRIDENREEIKKVNPFDLTDKSPLDILYECGRHNLPPMHAIQLLRGNVSDNYLRETATGIEDPDSAEMQSYADGLAMGEAEMSAILRQSTLDNKKDAYKSMNAEERKRVINASITKNFGIGE